MGSRKEGMYSMQALDDPDKSTLYEMEHFVVLRLPLDVAERVRGALENENRPTLLGNKFQISFAPHQDQRRATIKIDKKEFHAKLMDLPCIIEVLKTLDKKNFYKVADMSQMLICKSDTENDDNKEVTEKKKEKQFHLPHGITPPLKNVRKRRFRKTMKKKYVDAPEMDKELKRLLRADLDAVNVRWEVVTEEEERLQGEEGPSTDPQAGTAESLFGPKSTVQRPPEFSQLSLQEDLVFGGRVSSSSEEEGEGGALARELLAGGSGSGEDRDLKTHIFVCEAEIEELLREKAKLESEVRALDNEALRDKMKEKLKSLEKEEESKRQELNALQAQTKSK